MFARVFVVIFVFAMGLLCAAPLFAAADEMAELRSVMRTVARTSVWPVPGTSTDDLVTTFDAWHEEIVIAAPEGSLVIAPIDGEVIAIANGGECGASMVLGHILPNGAAVTTTYCHLADVADHIEADFISGEMVWVEAGDPMGTTTSQLSMGLHAEGRALHPLYLFMPSVSRVSLDLVEPGRVRVTVDPTSLTLDHITVRVIDAQNRLVENVEFVQESKGSGIIDVVIPSGASLEEGRRLLVVAESIWGKTTYKIW